MQRIQNFQNWRNQNNNLQTQQQAFNRRFLDNARQNATPPVDDGLGAMPRGWG